MGKTDTRYVEFYRTSDAQEALRLKMLFNRAGIPYVVLDELISTHVVPVPIRFSIPHDQIKAAEALLEAAFEVSPADIPPYCPACNAKTSPTSLDCPGCGLFLG